MHPRSDNRVFYVVLRKESFSAKEKKKGNSLLNTVPRNARKSSERKANQIFYYQTEISKQNA